jgi:hypothetical protein
MIQPLVIATPKPVAIEKIRHGVTEISLSDGRIVRLTIHVDGLKPAIDKIDIAYNVTVEVMAAPSAPIMDQHEPLQ